MHQGAVLGGVLPYHLEALALIKAHVARVGRFQLGHQTVLITALQHGFHELGPEALAALVFRDPQKLQMELAAGLVMLADHLPQRPETALATG